MRLGSPVVRRRARLEIIPLIDIMFFLLASFMMVSMTMMRIETVKMDLPTPTMSQPGRNPDILLLEVDAIGDAYVVEGSKRQHKSLPDLLKYLRTRHTANDRITAYIQGNPRATHGQVIAVLDLCRRAGIDKTSYNLTPATVGNGAE